MSLRPPRPIPPVPDDTARVTCAAFPRGNPYVLLRDRLGAVFDDAGLADLYPRRGQPACAPWRLALVTLLQFREGLSDRQVAEAVRARIDWKYLLGLNLTDPGFDHSVLCEFRGRLLRHEAVERLLARVLDAAREGGLLKARGRQRTDSTHVLAAVRDLNRVELLAETLRAALNAIAVAAPDWLRALAPAAWYERYGRRIEDARLPEIGPKRDAYVAQVGADGYRLLDALDGADAPPDATALPALAVLRRVWTRHFERAQGGPGADEPGGDGARLRPAQGRGPGDRVESPYDTDARFRTRAGTNWTGYMVHLTGTCDEGAPRLVVHVDTTPADVHEAMRTEFIHGALIAKASRRPSTWSTLPMSARVTSSRPARATASTWSAPRGRTRAGRSGRRTLSASQTSRWIGSAVTCAAPKVARARAGASTGTRRRVDPTSGPASARPTAGCAQPSRVAPGRRAAGSACTRARSTRRSWPPGRGRAPRRGSGCTRARRRGVEGTLSQAVRAFGLRRARYRGLAKAGLQNVATAAAINLDRLAAWFAERPLALTRVSRFAALAA